jgi:type IV secretory pathway TrbD component
MWIISALGLLVYSVGVIGSTIYSAASDPNPPSDIWKFKASAAPSFIGSAVYALEGINLALPTVHSMKKQEDGVKVVCSAVVMYAVLTLLFGAIGYAGGLGGGPDTLYSRAECDVVTRCISPQSLQSLLRVALSVAMLLSVPAMLFPATEMLEVAITELRARVRQRRERKRQQKLAHQQSFPPYKSYQSPGEILLETPNNIPDASRANAMEQKRQDELPNHGTEPDTWYHSLEEKLASIDDDGLHTAGSIHLIEKNWKLRVGLAIWIMGLAIAVPSFTLFSALVGAVGLSFAGFILPCVLYLKGLQDTHEPIQYPILTVTGFLMAFGLYNMTVGGWSAFKDVLGGVLES